MGNHCDFQTPGVCFLGSEAPAEAPPSDAQIPSMEEEPGAVTVLDLAEFILGRPARTGGDFAEAGLPMLGGCASGGNLRPWPLPQAPEEENEEEDHADRALSSAT